MKKRLLSIFLVFTIIFSSSVMSFSVSAADYDWNDEGVSIVIPSDLMSIVQNRFPNSQKYVIYANATSSRISYYVYCYSSDFDNSRYPYFVGECPSSVPYFFQTTNSTIYFGSGLPGYLGSCTFLYDHDLNFLNCNVYGPSDYSSDILGSGMSGSSNGQIIYSDLILYDEYGDPGAAPSDYNAGIDIVEIAGELHVRFYVEPLVDDFNYQVFVDGLTYMGYTYDLPNLQCSTFLNFTNSASFTYTISLSDFRDWWTSLSSFDEEVRTGKLSMFVIPEDSASSDFIEVSISLDDDFGIDDTPFSEKKDYLDFPDISDYIEDLPAFPGWDPDLDIWENISNILRWLGDCIGTVVHNLIGILRWLYDSITILVKNLGILLYNLVVDLRKLLSYLFIPNPETMKAELDDKMPMLSQLISKFQSNFSLGYVNFSFFGNTYQLNFNNYLSSDVCSVFRTISVVIMNLLLIKHVYWLVTCLLSVNSSEGGE